MSNEQVPAYIARCPKCGGIILAVVDVQDNRAAVAQDVADAIRKGYAVERVTVGWVRDNAGNWCWCDDETADKEIEPQQLPLVFA